MLLLRNMCVTIVGAQNQSANSTAALRTSLQDVKMTSAAHKAEIVPSFVGEFSIARMRHICNHKVFVGTAELEARYLGGRHDLEER